jgi:hypothetical protein
MTYIAILHYRRSRKGFTSVANLKETLLGVLFWTLHYKLNVQHRP